jgi:hypothetical protein
MYFKHLYWYDDALFAAIFSFSPNVRRSELFQHYAMVTKESYDAVLENLNIKCPVWVSDDAAHALPVARLF